MALAFDNTRTMLCTSGTHSCQAELHSTAPGSARTASVLCAAADLTSGKVTLEDVIHKIPYLRRFWEPTEFKGARLHDSLPLAASPSRCSTADMLHVTLCCWQAQQHAEVAWDFLRCPSLHSSIHCSLSTTMLSCYAAILSRKDAMLSGAWAPRPINKNKYLTDNIDSGLAEMEPVEREWARTLHAVMKVCLPPFQCSVLHL